MAEVMKFLKWLPAMFIFAALCHETALVTCEMGFGRTAVPVHYLLPEMNLDPNETDSLVIYCYRGYEKTAFHVFSTVMWICCVCCQPDSSGKLLSDSGCDVCCGSCQLQLHVKSGRSGYDYYQGASPKEVMEKYEEHQSSWSLSTSWLRYTSNHESIVLKTFEQECIGIKTSDHYVVVVDVISLDFRKVCFLCCGLLLFFLAPRLSHNDVFFYLCGISLGICSSFLIITYFISKLIPKKTMMVGAILSSWSLGLFLFKYLLDNFQYLAQVYMHYVLSYVVGAGFISFALCYRMGPPTNPRSKNLIQWALQCCSLGLIWNSSSHTEMKCAIVFVVLLLYNFPSFWTHKVKTYWIHKFPPKKKFLSEEEFIEQGAKETQKALESLKAYCSSPECNAWKTVVRVKSPRRFAEFMNGAPHVSNEELLAYELHSRSAVDDIYTDDSSQSDDSFYEKNSYSDEILK